MIEPPIDKLIDKAGCKYVLACLISRRAKFLMDKKLESLEHSGAHAVTMAAEEIYAGDVVAAYE